MLLGIWKSVEELEENINLEELSAILSAQQEREASMRRFMAALKGFDLDEGQSAKDRVDEMKRRVEAERAGTTVDELDLLDMGIEVETIED